MKNIVLNLRGIDFTPHIFNTMKQFFISVLIFCCAIASMCSCSESIDLDLPDYEGKPELFTYHVTIDEARTELAQILDAIDGA